MNFSQQYRLPLLCVIVLMILYSAYFSVLSIQRHNTFRTHKADMGQMDQALWNTLHGNILQDTRPDGHNAPRLTDHVEPIFLVIPFVFLIYDHINALFILQSIAIALGALPLFWIAQRRLKSDWAAVAFAAMYLLLPALEAANLAEFHAITFAPAPLLLAYNYGQERSWKRFALFAVIALAVKEEVALLVFAMAIYFAFTTADRRPPSANNRFSFHVSRFTFYVSKAPFLIALISVIWFLIALYVIVPRFAPGGGSVYVGRYTCASQAIRNPLTAIPNLIGCIVIPEKIGYVIGLLASAGFIAVFDPIALLVGSPSLILNILSSYDAQYSGTYHYSAPVAPYFVLAAIGGAAWLVDRIRNSKFKIRNPLALTLVPVFLIALGYHAIAGYTPIGGEFFSQSAQVTPHQQLFDRFAKQIPPDVKISTMGALFPHLSHRRVIYLFPTVLDAEYILLDVSQANTANPIDFVTDYRKALDNGFGIRDALGGYILLQRGLPQKELPDEFFSFLRACSCTQLQVPLQVNFDNKLLLLGYDVKQDDWQRVYLRLYFKRLSGMDNNFAIYPFFPDDSGNPRADAQLPDLMFPFWYPTMRWQADEIIAVETTPIDVGARAKIGLGVFFGATWDNAEFYLKPNTSAPISADGKWVSLGEIVRNGKTYVVAK
ncbi:MAG: DUF2079 domain-containing protein [Chloroflexi bacterium]|nr:DUF2079 domain-containing protein [Chloroflexota bacterium]